MKSNRIHTMALCAMLMSIPGAMNAVEFALPQITGESGATALLNMEITNGDVEVINFQCDITLPDGITPTIDERGGVVCLLSPERADGHVLESASINGVYRILCYSGRNYPLKETSGTVFSLPIRLDVDPGEYEVKVSGCVLTYPDGEIFSQYLQPDFSSTITVIEAQPKREIPDYSFFCEPVTLGIGQDTEMAIGLKNIQAVKAFSFTLPLPPGVEVSLNDLGEYADYNDRVPNRFEIESDFADGVLSINGATTRSTTVEADTEGSEIIYILLSANDAAVVGNYDLRFENQRFTLGDDTEIASEAFVGTLSIEIIESGVEGISTDNHATPADGYDLLGRPVHRSHRGIVISNGRKVMQ